MRLCHFEDRPEQFEPLTLTRPLFDLRCGISTLAEKQARLLPQASRGLWLRPSLAELVRTERPRLPVNDLDWLRSGDTLFVNGRWLPSAQPLERGPCVGLIGGEIAYVCV